MPTLQLTPVEMDAIAQGSQDARATHPDGPRMLTVENVRLALGSTSMTPARAAPAVTERGPRRARETLQVDKIKPSPAVPDPPSRKR
ncbi:MAG TPA: hypothetical protein VFT22_04445 [Kofleriaceae bacterium]|nr:hypothetical protein [Kofleriaceae bacterium]